MRRRDFIILVAGAMGGWPAAVRAQQKAMPVIGILGLGSAATSEPFVAAFRQGLSETGYVEGQNITIEYRWAEDRYDRLPALAADLVGRKVEGNWQLFASSMRCPADRAWTVRKSGAP